MSKYSFTILIERDEDGVFVANVPALRGCHTQARTFEELMPRIQEAVELCLEVIGIDEENSIDYGYTGYSG
ncbi:type II toxin-antitoxin system HicB family antitoxin [bacterium]|nr:type II toxin-antitoxin system HicB family antitoxin [FCB group bacterium]MBL7190741.1 type II toxin-antitoxin system HicB family antitoxin [bacterium]